METGQPKRVAMVSQRDETKMALTKARSWRPALLLKMVRGMIPFLMVPETRAPTRTAPCEV